MKRIIIILATIACINGVFYIHSALAESKAETYLGVPEMCLDMSRIKQTIILDDRTILFITLGGEVYINRLPFKCSGLKTADGFGYSTSLTKICKQDIITALWPDFASGSKCGLGDFWPFKYEGKYRDAIKLLKEGLLKELVEEGAFKESLPDNK